MIPSFFSMYRTFGTPHPQRSTLLFWKPVKAISQAPGQVSQRLRRLACIGFPVSGDFSSWRAKGMLVIQEFILRVFSLDANVLHLLIDDYEIMTWYWLPIFFQPRAAKIMTLIPFFVVKIGEFPKISISPSLQGLKLKQLEPFPRSVITFGERCSLSSAHNRLVEPASWCNCDHCGMQNSFTCWISLWPASMYLARFCQIPWTHHV